MCQSIIISGGYESSRGLTWSCLSVRQVIRWLYLSIGRPPPPEFDLPGRGAPGAGRDWGRPREGPEDGGRVRKRPRSPSFDGSSSRRAVKQEMGGPGSGGRGDPRFGPTSTHASGGGAEARGGGAYSDPPELEELIGLVDRMCSHGDSCPSLQGGSPCSALHSSDMPSLGASEWARETVLTFLRSHPSVQVQVMYGDEKYEAQAWKEGAWKGGLKRVVRRWRDSPDRIRREAPAVPLTGVPQGAERKDLSALRDFVLRLCMRGNQCKYVRMGVCRAVHPNTHGAPEISRWVQGEVKRMLQTHPSEFLRPSAYKTMRSEAVERVWKASLARQVERWLEHHQEEEEGAGQPVVKLEPSPTANAPAPAQDAAREGGAQADEGDVPGPPDAGEGAEGQGSGPDPADTHEESGREAGEGIASEASG
jgi:hypothetical protein